MKIANQMHKELDPLRFDKEQIEGFRDELEKVPSSPNRETILMQLYFLLEAWENYTYYLDMNLDTSNEVAQLENNYKDLIELVKSYTLPAPAA